MREETAVVLSHAGVVLCRQPRKGLGMAKAKRWGGGAFLPCLPLSSPPLPLSHSGVSTPISGASDSPGLGPPAPPGSLRSPPWLPSSTSKSPVSERVSPAAPPAGILRHFMTHWMANVTLQRDVF